MYTRVTLSLFASSSLLPSFSCPWPCFSSVKKKQRSPGGHLLASLFLVLILFLVLHSRSLGNHLSTFYPFFVCLGCSFFFIVTIATVTIVSFFPSVSSFLGPQPPSLATLGLFPILHAQPLPSSLLVPSLLIFPKFCLSQQ